MISDHLRGRRFSTSSLPEEIIEQIIARVPCTKTTMRCASVCKSWYALIKSTHLINFHLSLIPNNNKIAKLLLCEHDESDNPDFIFIFICDGIEAFKDSSYFLRHAHDDHCDEISQAPYFAIHNDNEAFREYYRLGLPRHHLLQLHGCNGLLCFNLSHDPNCLYLSNPAIAKFKTLPTPLLLNQPHHLSVFKLWFDCKTNDYNILRICYTTNTCAVEVYTLSTNSWKLITDDAPVTTSFLNSNRLAYVNGIFYWPALRDGNWNLISLDTKNWMFREKLTTWPASQIYLTPSWDNDSLVVLGYGDIQDPLLDLRSRCSVFEVYDHSLNKLYTVDPEDAQRIDQHQPLGFRNNGELLFQDFWDHLEIVSYNLETKTFKEFVPTTGRRLFRTIPFVETLALYNDADATRIPLPRPKNLTKTD